LIGGATSGWPGKKIPIRSANVLGSGLAFLVNLTYASLMSRPLRIEFPDAIYHVTVRGDRREDIYRDDEDRQAQLDVPAHASWTALMRKRWRTAR
jgi:hypothetical protein